MTQWLSLSTGVISDEMECDSVPLLHSYRFYCLSHGRECHVDAYRARSTMDSVAAYYRAYWEDCQLPTRCPYDRVWGSMWREMLGWLYGNGASREVVLRAWKVFRNHKLEWLVSARPFQEVYRLLYSIDAEVNALLSESSAPGVLTIQRELIPIGNSWVADEMKFEHSFVRVEGRLHDEEVPLYLVVHVPWDWVTPSAVWVVGRDRHTKTLFALQVLAQIRSLDTALRWTLGAEPWDTIIEV